MYKLETYQRTGDSLTLHLRRSEPISVEELLQQKFNSEMLLGFVVVAIGLLWIYSLLTQSLNGITFFGTIVGGVIIYSLAPGLFRRTVRINAAALCMETRFDFDLLGIHRGKSRAVDRSLLLPPFAWFTKNLREKGKFYSDIRLPFEQDAVIFRCKDIEEQRRLLSILRDFLESVPYDAAAWQRMEEARAEQEMLKEGTVGRAAKTAAHDGDWSAVPDHKGDRINRGDAGGDTSKPARHDPGLLRDATTKIVRFSIDPIKKSLTFRSGQGLSLLSESAAYFSIFLWEIAGAFLLLLFIAAITCCLLYYGWVFAYFDEGFWQQFAVFFKDHQQWLALLAWGAAITAAMIPCVILLLRYVLRWPFWKVWTITWNRRRAVFSYRDDRTNYRRQSMISITPQFRLLPATPDTNPFITGRLENRLWTDRKNPGWQAPFQVVVVTEDGSFPLPCASEEEQTTVIRLVESFLKTNG